ncbi:lipocalin family protein [Actinomadura flavalba]|uniref:lipocalin family protein n=1 Tax=Actinomadura flavalba TaxID=1120938 RepID=UPI0003818C29|nr:lipocalin family protein [Actinomadura flavalba]
MRAKRTMRAVTVGAVAAAATVAGAGAASAEAPVPPVASVDVPRYLGTWYQVAAVPQWFEIQCVKNVTARYGLAANGSVAVENRCAAWFGATSAVQGEAKPLDATNARLNVSFVRWDGAYVHQKTANYIVVGLDRDYGWATVTDAGRGSGFVLSRRPALSAEQTAAAQASLRGAGVDPCRLKVTAQDGGRSDKGAAFC